MKANQKISINLKENSSLKLDQNSTSNCIKKSFTRSRIASIDSSIKSSDMELKSLYQKSSHNVSGLESKSSYLKKPENSPN